MSATTTPHVRGGATQDSSRGKNRFSVGLSTDAIIRLASAAQLVKAGAAAIKIVPIDDEYAVTPQLLSDAAEGVSALMTERGLPLGGKAELAAALVARGCDEEVAAIAVNALVAYGVLSAEADLLIDGKSGEGVLDANLANAGVFSTRLT